MAAKPKTLDRERIRTMTARELEAFNAKTPKSAALYERARTTLACGIGSSYQWRDPWPIYLREGKGSHLWDIDGNEYLDYLNGFGSMVQGHAHPAIVKAIQEQVLHGQQFSEPVEDGVIVAEELATTLEAAQVALHEHRVRVHHGRDPHRACRHASRRRHEDLRLVPRPPRLRDGLGAGQLRRLRAARRLRLVPLRCRHPRRRRPDDRRRALQRPRRDGEPPQEARRRGQGARPA